MILLLIFGFGVFLFGYHFASAIAPAINRRDRLVIAFPLGAGFYTLAIFCLNSAFGVLIQQSSLWWLLGTCALLSCGWTVLRNGRQCSGEPESLVTPRIPLTALARFEFVLLLILISLLAITAVLVPVENWDVYSEYLPRAKEIFLTHTISIDASPSPVDLVRALPVGHCLLIASGYCIAGFLTHPWARLLTPLYACLLLALLYRIGRRHLAFSSETTLGGLLLCASLPLFYGVMIIPTGTIPFCLCTTASLYFFMERGESRGGGVITLSGIFLGLAYWISYTGTVLLACVFTLLILLSVAAACGKRVFPSWLQLKPREFILLFFPAILIATPHMLRNYVMLGNPIYPALYRLLGGAWINNWSIAHLIPRVVPAHFFFFRPRWELFHEGFFIQLLFFLFLFSRPWYKNGKCLFLASFCVLYVMFHIKFLTWPRGSGISTKLLLPSLIPMSLFAGERLNLILRRKIPLWQGAVILALVPLWAIVIWRDEMISLGIRDHLSLTHPKDMIHLVWALSTDFDKILIWISIALGLVSAKVMGKTAGRMSAALLLFALTCRPFGECAHQLALHLQEYMHSPSYSFWNAAVFPFYFPEAAWLDNNLPPDAVIGSLDNRTSIYPRRVFPLDSPLLWPMYQGMDIAQCIALLRQNGVTHLCLSDHTTKPHPLYVMSPIFNNLGNPGYFPLLYRGPAREEPGQEFNVYGIREQKGQSPSTGSRS